jgi:hypothetical protein
VKGYAGSPAWTDWGGKEGCLPLIPPLASEVCFYFSRHRRWDSKFVDFVCCVGEACYIASFFWHWESPFLRLHDQDISKVSCHFPERLVAALRHTPLQQAFSTILHLFLLYDLVHAPNIRGVCHFYYFYFHLLRANLSVSIFTPLLESPVNLIMCDLQLFKPPI